LSFVDEFGPLYALYTLWFNDNGITTSQISTVFVLWAAVAIVLEIPSGAVADRVDRRSLLAGAFGLRAAGIGVWMVWPSLNGMLIGAVLWAVHGSLASGAWEAFIHDQLEAVGEQQQYARVMARVGQFSNLGVAGGTLVATLLVSLGLGIEALGWITVVIHVVSISLVPVFVLIVWVGLLAGGEVAARLPFLSGRKLGSSLVVGAGAMAVAISVDGLWLLALVGVGYAMLEMVRVLGDARMQERIPAATRATTTSVRSFLSALILVVGFAVVGALSSGDDPSRGLLPIVGALALTGLAVFRWLPNSQPGVQPSRDVESGT